MMKALVLSEKPSVGKDLARVLGCTNTQNFCEGAYVVTWALGHLVTLADPHLRSKTETMAHGRPAHAANHEITSDPQHVASISCGRPPDAQREDISELVYGLRGAEGELVARWIIKLAGWKNLLNDWISSQTDEAIRAGFCKPEAGKMYDPLYASARCRAEAIWLIGLNVTRACLQNTIFSLNAGRVQTHPWQSWSSGNRRSIHAGGLLNPSKPISASTRDCGAIRTGNSCIFDHLKAQELAERIAGQSKKHH